MKKILTTILLTATLFSCNKMSKKCDCQVDVYQGVDENELVLIDENIGFREQSTTITNMFGQTSTLINWIISSDPSQNESYNINHDGIVLFTVDSEYSYSKIIDDRESGDWHPIFINDVIEQTTEFRVNCSK